MLHSEEMVSRTEGGLQVLDFIHSNCTNIKCLKKSTSPELLWIKYEVYSIIECIKLFVSQ